MGRAKIIEHLGEGQYRIQRLYADADRIEQIIADIAARLSVLAADLSNAQQGVFLAEQAEEDALEATRLAASAYIADSTAEKLSEYEKTLMALRAAQFASMGARRDRDRIQRMIDVANSRRAMYQAAEAPANETAWSTDYTLTRVATTDAPTIELNDEETGLALIVAPGSSPLRPPWHVPAADGELMPRQWMSPEQAYFNAAILPGMQRHKPIYRAGELLAIDRDLNTGTVQLDSAESSAQALLINPINTTLTDVPFVYMECDHVPFEVGDAVVVEFPARDNFANPVIIGFKTHPQPCLVPGGYIVIPTNAANPNGWPGATIGSPRHYISIKDTNPPDLFSDSPLRADPITWRGSSGRILSYSHGGTSRYAFGGLDGITAPGNSDLHMLGCRILTGAERKVVGAGIYSGWLLIVSRVDSGGVAADSLWATPDPYGGLFTQFQAGTTPAQLSPDWTLIGPIPRGSETRRTKPWFFAPNGDTAATAERDWEDGRVWSFVSRLKISIDSVTSLPVFEQERERYEYDRLLVKRDPTIVRGQGGPATDIQTHWGDWVYWETVEDAEAEAQAALAAGMAGWPNSNWELHEWRPEMGTGTGNTFIVSDSQESPLAFTYGIPRVRTAKVGYYWTVTEDNFPQASGYGGIAMRPGYTLFTKEGALDSTRYTLEGRDLVGVEYDASGKEILIELRAHPDENDVSLYWMDRSRYSLKGRPTAHSGTGVVMESTVAWELTRNLAEIGEAHRDTGVNQIGHFGSPSPGYQIELVERRTVCRTDGALTIQLTADGLPLHEVTIPDNKTLVDFGEVLDSYTIDVTTGAGFWEFFVSANIQLSSAGISTEFCELEPAPVIDVDGPMRSVLAAHERLRIEVVDLTYSSAQVVDIQIVRPGTKTIEITLKLRDQTISLGAAGTPSDPVDLPAPFDGAGNVMTYVTFSDALVGLLTRSLAQNLYTQGSGSGVHASQCATGLMAIRSGRSAAVSFETSVAPIRQGIFAQINDATVDLVPLLDVPTTDGLRIFPIGAI